MLLATDRQTLFTAEVTETSEARAGTTATLALNPERFHFFVPETGETLLREPAVAA
jgi:hypothetical protein